MQNENDTLIPGRRGSAAVPGSALFQRVIANHADPLTRRVWGGTPWMLEVFTDSWDSERRKAITDWCEETFGTESRPIHNIRGEWKTGNATVHGWTWMGFATEAQMERFAARWPNQALSESHEK